MNTTKNLSYKDMDALMINLAWMEALAVCIIIIGFTAMYAVFYSSFAIEDIVGGSYLLAGAMFTAHAFGSKKWGRLAAELLLGGLYIVCAVLVLSHPGGVETALRFFPALLLGLKGILKAGSVVRQLTEQGREWLLASGIISLLIGFILGLGLASGTAWFVGVLVGMDLAFSGLSTIMLCHEARKSLSEKEPFCFGETCFVR